MSFFTRLFGSKEENTKLTLREIADALGLQDPSIEFNGEKVGTLKALWNGASLRLRFTEGRVLRCTLAHDSLKQHFDLEHDFERRKEPVFPLPDASSHAEEAEGAVHIGGGLLCERKHLKSFVRLPADLRARMPKALADARVCYFRAGRDVFDITFHGDSEAPVGREQITGALALAMDVCKARGLVPRAPAAAGSTKEERVYSPLSTAKSFAKRMPGATVEDLGGMGRESIWARVSFEHEGVPMRLVFYRFDTVTCGVWLETRAVGRFGEFGVMKFDPTEETAEETTEEATDADEDEDEDEDEDDDEDEDEDDEDEDDDDASAGPTVRIFVSKDCYVDGARATSEAAHVLSLPAQTQAELLALVLEVGTVVLKEQVLSLNLGELTSFVDARSQHRGELPYPVALAARLAALAGQIPVQPKELVALAEYRTCRFCTTAYVFSPTTPACIRCGAPPEMSTT